MKRPKQGYPSPEIESVLSRTLGVRHGEVTHLLAGRVEDHSHVLGEPATRSRDFQ